VRDYLGAWAARALVLDGVGVVRQAHGMFVHLHYDGREYALKDDFDPGTLPSLLRDARIEAAEHDWPVPVLRLELKHNQSIWLSVPPGAPLAIVHDTRKRTVRVLQK
jgi:hypothetical protein